MLLFFEFLKDLSKNFRICNFLKEVKLSRIDLIVCFIKGIVLNY
mgnify:CR=1 FL=1